MRSLGARGAEIRGILCGERRHFGFHVFVICFSIASWWCGERRHFGCHVFVKCYLITTLRCGEWWHILCFAVCFGSWANLLYFYLLICEIIDIQFFNVFDWLIFPLLFSVFVNSSDGIENATRRDRTYDVS